MPFVTDACLSCRLVVYLATLRRNGWGIQTCRPLLATPISAYEYKRKMARALGLKMEEKLPDGPHGPPFQDLEGFSGSS